MARPTFAPRERRMTSPSETARSLGWCRPEQRAYPVTRGACLGLDGKGAVQLVRGIEAEGRDMGSVHESPAQRARC